MRPCAGQNTDKRKKTQFLPISCLHFILILVCRWDYKAPKSIDPSWSVGACKYPLVYACVCATAQARLALKVPPPLFLPPLLLLFPSLSHSLLPIQAVKLSSSLLPNGPVKPRQTKHGQAARHSPHTYTQPYRHKNIIHIHVHIHAHTHAPTQSLVAGVRSCPTPHKQ